MESKTFTKSDAEKAMTLDCVSWESPVIDIIDTLAYALADFYPNWSCERCLDRADTLALRWAR